MRVSRSYLADVGYGMRVSRRNYLADDLIWYEGQ